MAMDYEVRPEYENLPLAELLDTSVMCFQGVGDTQFDVLQRFFGVKTVRDLANLPYFLWSLGIQEQALKGEGNGGRPVGELAKERPLKFSVRPEYAAKTARELLASPVRALEGLSPAQALALYDGFRITNVTQIVQNRIMLEARIIEYLQKVESGEIPEAATDEQIASILLAGADVPDAEAVRRALAGDGEGKGGEISELTAHLRARIDELRNRARQKAGEIASRPSATSEELAEEAGRVRPTAPADTRTRLEAIRESRFRHEQEAVLGGRAADQVTAGISSRQAIMERLRGETQGAGARPGGVVRANVPPPPRSAAAPRAPTAPAAAATAEGTQAGRPAARATRPPQRGAPWGPWIVAAVVAILILGGIWIWLRSTEPPTSTTATLETTTQPAAPEAQPVAPAQPGVAGQAAPGVAEQGAAATQPQPAAEEPRLPVRAVHKVRVGQSLWRISRGYYKNPELWPWIYRENRNILADPDLIYPNQRINIPEIP